MERQETCKADVKAFPGRCGYMCEYPTERNLNISGAEDH